MSQSSTIVFRNVRVFPGHGTALSGPQDVRVDGSTITSLGPVVGGPVDPGVTVIEGAGRVLIPGLIDAHWHAAFAAVSAQVAMTCDVGYLHLAAGREAGRTLMRGFTTVRDAGGPTFALKRAIDEGLLPGPRILPSGAFISQTSGHGDFRARHEVPRDPCSHLSHIETMGGSAIADGVPEVLRAVREQLMLGASQIKVMAGGGLASSYDPIDVTEYTEPEVRAAVEAAENWGTYVMVHAYTPRAIAQAIRAGVRCIEHGHLIDEATVEMMAEHDVWWSLQPFLDDEDAIQNPNPANRVRQLEVSAGTDRAYELARKHGVRIVRRRAGQPAGQAAGEDDPLVHPGGGPHDGHLRQRGSAVPIRSAPPLPRSARSRRTRRLGRSPAGRWRPTRRPLPARRPQPELVGDHEGWRDPQEHFGLTRRSGVGAGLRFVGCVLGEPCDDRGAGNGVQRVELIVDGVGRRVRLRLDGTDA
jgi:imidazolonepropionase-like amidohydrolase